MLTEKGPVFFNCAQIDESGCYRGDGNLYYARGFAEIVKTEALVHRSKVRTLLPRLAMRAMEHGSHLSALLPSKRETWWSILEDIFFSPVAQEVRAQHMYAMVVEEEMESISIDCTTRVTWSLVGQAH